jgi:hypothetical protein
MPTLSQARPASSTARLPLRADPNLPSILHNRSSRESVAVAAQLGDEVIPEVAQESGDKSILSRRPNQIDQKAIVPIRNRLSVESVLLLDKEDFYDSNIREDNEGCGD